MLILGLCSEDRKSTRDTANISNPKVNRGCPPFRANRPSADCVQISLGPSIHYISLWVYHAGRVTTMRNLHIFIQENAFEKVVGQTASFCLDLNVLIKTLKRRVDIVTLPAAHIMYLVDLSSKNLYISRIIECEVAIMRSVFFKMFFCERKPSLMFFLGHWSDACIISLFCTAL